MFFNLNIIVFFVFIMSYFRYTLSETWITDLVIPDRETVRLCDAWITFYGFTDNAYENRNKAISRNRSTDGKVFAWAASYAMHLATFTHYPLTPNYFCKGIHNIGYGPYTYAPLNEIKKTCRNWIEFHSFCSESTEEIGKKLSIIENRNKNEDVYNSIWATSYIRFLNKHKAYALMNPIEYCIKIGNAKYIPELLEMEMPYMTIKDTKMTCQKWIELHGFTDDINQNKNLVSEREIIFDDFINQWAFKYTNHIRTTEKKQTLLNCMTGRYRMTPKEFCEIKLEKTTEDLPFE